MEIRYIKSESDAKRSFPIMQVLRPNLNENEFIERLDRQRAQGYVLIACFDEQNEIAALAGFRIQYFMAWGKVLYIDDLITNPEKKRKGYGGALLDWIEAYAKELECDEIHLDSGYARLDAHRLYLNKGLELTCHHFAKKVKT